MVLQKLDKAQEVLTTGIEKNPASVPLYTALGRLYIGTRQPEKAKEIIQQGIKSSDRNESLYNMLARLYMGLRQTETAIDTLRQAITLIPDTDDAGTRKSALTIPLAEILLSTGQSSEAEQLVNQVLNKQPEHLQALFINGEILLAKGDNEAAIKAFENCCKAKSTFSKGSWAACHRFDPQR